MTVDRVDALARRARARLDDGFLARGRGGLTRDEDGHLIQEQDVEHPAYGTVNVTRDLTAQRMSAPRRSNNYEIFRIEAELLAAGRALDNPAIPVSDERADEIEARLGTKGLEPAWEIHAADVTTDARGADR